MAKANRTAGLHLFDQNDAALPADIVPLAIGLVRSATITNDSWKKAVSADWSTAADWTTGTVAGSSNAATIGVAGNYTVTISTQEYANSLLINNATATVSDTSQLGVTGTLSLKAGTFSLSQAGYLSATSLAISSGATFSTINGSGGSYAGAISNAGLISVSASSGLALGGGGALGTVSGQGALELISGSYTDSIAPLSNLSELTLYGAVTLALSGASGTLAAELVLSGSGSPNSGNLSIGSGVDLTLSGGLTSGNYYYAGGGSIDGPGTLTTAGTSSIYDGNAGYPALWVGGGLTWINTGTVDDNDQIYLNTVGNDTVNIFNAAGASFDLTSSDAGLQEYSSGTDSFTNAGTLALTIGDVTNYFYPTLINTGLISIAAGSALELADGGTLGGTINGAGTLELVGGTFASGSGLNGASEVYIVGGASLSVSTSGTLAADLVLSGNGSPGAGNLSIGSGVDLTLSGGLTSGNDYYAGGGSIDGPGTLTTAGTSSIYDSNAGYTALWVGGGLTWINTGTVDDNDQIYLNTVGNDTVNIVNAAGANFDLTSSDAGLQEYSNGTDSFTNEGTLALISGGVTNYFGLTLINTGLISIAAGSALELADGGTLGGTINGAGTLELVGGTFASGSGLNGASEVYIVGGASLSVSTSGTLAADLVLSGNGSPGAGNLSIGSGVDLTLSGGLTSGNDYYAGGGSIDGPGTLTTAGTSSIYDSNAGYTALWVGGGLTWINTGTVDDNDQIYLNTVGNDTVNIVNAAGASFDLTSSDAGLQEYSSGTDSFTNAGTLALTVGDVTNYFYPTLINTGLISIAAGSTLDLQQGGTLGGTISGPGTLELGAGIFTNAGGLAGTGNIEILNYASLQIAASGTLTTALTLSGGAGLYNLSIGSGVNLTLSGTFDSGDYASDYGGSVVGPGTLTTTGTTNFTEYSGGYAVAYLGGGITWINTGTVNESGLIYLNTQGNGDAVSIVNAAGASFNLTSNDASVQNYYDYPGTDSFTNAGTLASTGGTSTTNFGMELTSTGVVTASTGTLAFNTAGDSFSGTIGATGKALVLLEGTNSYATTGALTIADNGTLTALALSTWATLSNAGTISDAGALALGLATTDSTALINAAGAVLDLTTNNAQITAKGTATITNAGLIAKTGGSAQSVITGSVTNSGTIEAVTGSLKISGSALGTGILKIDSGATLEIGVGIAPKEIVTFAGGAGATLKLDKPASLGTLTGFGGGDRLDLAGITATSASISGTILTVATASTSTTYVSAALAGDAVTTGTDGSGGTYVNIFRQASASHTPEPLAFGNRHVGATATLGLTVSNTAAADGYSENLDASLGSATTGFTAAGSATGIAAGASNSGSFSVSMNTAAAGAYSGTAILTLTSDGKGIDNRTTTAIGTQTVTLTGAVYAYAAAHFTSTSITLANQHVGANDFTVLTLGNTAAANGYSENLDAAFAAASGSATDSGSATGIAAGASSNALHVGLTTTGAGAESGTARIVLTSDGTGIDGLGTTILGTQTVSVTGNVYAYASGTLASSSITFGNHHVGDVVGAQALMLTNGAAANGYSEALDAALSGAGAGITTSGSLTGLAAGSTDSSSLLIGENTGIAGAISGSVTLGLISDGTGIDGLGTTTLASQTIAVTGGVYAYAVGELASSTINLGVIHAGSSVSAALALSNAALANGYAEALDAGLSGASAGVLTSGSVMSLAAGASSNALLLGVDTTNTGGFSGTALLGLISDGTTIDGLGTTTLASQTVTITATVDNYAVAAIEDLSSGNTLTGTSTNETINLGSALQGGSALTVDLGVLNAAKGLSDLLGGTISTAGSTTGFTNTGFGTFSGLGAGASESAQIVSLNTGTTGTFSETIVLASAGSNASGYSGALANETLTIVGTITPGGTTVYNLALGPNVIIGAAGLSDVFNASAGALNSRDQLTGNATTNVLNLVGAGLFDVNAPTVLANIPTINASEGQAAKGTLAATSQVILLRDGVGETVNVAAGKAAAGNTNAEQITIYGGTGSDVINLASGSDTVYLGTGAETVLLGGAKNAVYGGGGNAIVDTSAANAAASVVGTTTGITTLDITTAGTVVLNAADTYVAVNLIAGSKLTMDKLGFISANGAAGTDTITAGATNQTLIGGKGDVLTGYTGGGDNFAGVTAGLNADTIANWTTGDILDITDMANATIRTYAASKLTVGNGSLTDTITIKGVTGTTLAIGNFTVIGSDGSGGTLIGWHG